MFEPLIISMEEFEKLTPEQQKIFEEEGAELQEYAYKASQEDDVRVDKEFEEAGVKVVPMDDNPSWSGNRFPSRSGTTSPLT